MIKIEHLDYGYTNRLVLKDISLNIERGEIVGIIGANGSGKTTLLKCIVGLYETNKKVILDDKAIEDYAFKDRAKKIALMHQSEMINFDFSCFDVVSLGRFAYLGAFAKMTDNDIAVVTNKMADTNTSEFSERIITQLSGGERQRILFAKTLTQEAPYILLDEPSSTLDIKHEKEILEMAKLLSQQNCALIISIHNIRLAAKYCKRLILLSDGKILADGKPEDVITANNLKIAYDVDAEVYYNEKAGQIDFVVK